MNNFPKQHERIVAAVDIGAGQGAKIVIAGINGSKIDLLGTVLYRQRQYGNSANHFLTGLLSTLKELMSQLSIPPEDLSSLGIDLPGFLDSDQNILKCANLPFLNGSNIRTPLEESLGVPVNLINDANSGALAEWNAWKTELIYWVFGGGWGGAWISKEGEIKHPTLHWNGCDTNIHISNEPGFIAEISKDRAADIFKKYGFSFDKFLKNTARELGLLVNEIKGPFENPETVRSEAVVSSLGLWRIFHLIMTDSHFSRYTAEEQKTLMSSDTAGAMISTLFLNEDPMAQTCFQLFSDFFQESALSILSQIVKEGAPKNIPIFVSGGLANAYDQFAHSAQKVIYEAGFESTLQKSYLMETGQNANIMGAIFLAMQNT